MKKRQTKFKRMVLGLPLGAADHAVIDITADFAELFGVDLLATFFEEVSLLELAAIPCIRELRPLGGGWQPIDAIALSKELERAAASARARFIQTVSRRTIQTNFEIARGAPADVISTMAQADDIVVLIEPRNPVERVTQQFARLVDAAFRTAAAVMMVPARVIRTAGPIVAYALTPEDSSVRAGIAIATAARERLIVVHGKRGSSLPREIGDLAAVTGVKIEELTANVFATDPLTLSRALEHLKERLVVMTRGALSDTAIAEIAGSLKIPMLIVEPD